MTDDATPATGTHFEGATPILNVRDLDASLACYVDILGFKVDWRVPYMVSVSRDRAHLMLCEGAQGHPGTWVWIGVSDAQRLHDVYRQAGAKVRLPPTNFPWALEIHVEDPDGHVLRMGSEPLEGVPFGEWPRDERGASSD